MARGLTDSFIDILVKVSGDLNRALFAPDADPAFINQLIQIIQDYVRGSPMTPNPPGPPGMGGAQPFGGAPVPVVPGEMSRGPTPNPDLSGLTAELAAQLP